MGGNKSNNEKTVWYRRVIKLILKLLLTVIITYASIYVGLILILLCASEGINGILSFCSMLVLPTLLISLIFIKNRRKVFKYWIVFVLVYIIAIGINIGVNKYNKKITIDTNPNIDCSEYLPFKEDSKIVKLGYEASLKLENNLPIVDGAAAVFPVYSAFVNATYPSRVELYDGTFEYNNTVLGYKLLGENQTDIFFGAYPSEEQVESAKSKGTEFEYTEIAKEAFVFFVHKDNPIESLTTEQIKDIYSGEITNWKEVGGKNEKIVAFQRNQGSGSQSMLIRFMNGRKIMEVPSEQVNDFMSGIVERVADYKNKTSSIGFSFRYYIEGIMQNPDIKILSIDGIAPTVENVKTGFYPITTSLYAVTYKDNQNENVQELINWVLSEEGQEIIEKTGYVRIN